MDILQLEEFKSLVGTLSYSETAYKLNVSTSTLSRHIQKLEDELGGTLFDRNTRSITLTPFGAMFLPHAVRILQEYHDGMASVRKYLGRNALSLVLGVVDAIEEYSIIDYIMDFEKAYPNCNLQIISGNSAEMEQGFREGQFNIFTATGHRQDEALKLLKVGITAFKAVVAEASPFANTDVLRLSDLTEYGLCVPRKSSPYYDVIVDNFKQMGTTPSILFTGRFEDSVSYIRSGRGVGLFLFREGRHTPVEGLRFIDIDPEIAYEYGFGYRRTLSTSEELFIGHMKKLVSHPEFAAKLG